MTPLARTMKRLNETGWTAEIVERRLCSKVKKDPFGADVIAVKGLVTMAVQVTDTAHFAEHRKDLEANPNARAWVSAGNSLQCWAWRVRGKPKDDPLVWDLLLPTWTEEEDG